MQCENNAKFVELTNLIKILIKKISAKESCLKISRENQGNDVLQVCNL